MIVILSAAVFTGFQLNKQTLSEQEQEELHRNARQISSELDARLLGLERTVELWSTNPAVARHGSRLQREALATFVNRSAFTGASVVAANGTMTNIVAGIDGETRENLVGRDFGERPYVQRALRGETYVSEPFRAASGNYVVTVSTPVRRDGRIVGTLNAAFHLSNGSFFSAVISTTDPAHDVTIRAADGSLLYATDRSPPADALVRTATVAETGWTIEVRESRASIASAIRPVTYMQIGGVLLVSLLLAGFGGWIYQRNLRQTDAVLGGFEALEEQEYGTRISVSGSEEWTQIGEGFNRTSRALESHRRKQRERERQLQVLDRVLRHNMHNDMNVVMGYAESIQRRTDGDVATDAGRILAASRKLLETVDKERDIVDAVAEPEPVERVDVANSVRHAVEGVREEHPRATVELGAPASCEATATLSIERAVCELVENAVIHADRASPNVTVTVRATDDAVEIRVADDGPGIPEQEQNVLTDDYEIGPLYHGSGMGLWLVHWIVRRSGGDLSFEENDPRGSVVTVSLPLADDER
jgi:signal transduction histidine kinase